MSTQSSVRWPGLSLGRTRLRSALLSYGLTFLLVGLGLLYLYPFLWMLGSSLKTDREFFSQGVNVLPAGSPQWNNYNLAWNKANFGQYFLNSVINTVATAFCTVILTSMAAYALVCLNVPGKKIIITLMTATFLLPRGYTILPTLQLVKDLGLLNTYGATILLYVAGGMIFYTFLFFGYMRTMPKEIEEAAIIDGAGVPQRYWQIVLPLCRPMLGTVVLFSALGAWNEFFTALVMTLGNPSLRTLAVGMYAFVSQTKNDWTLMCAAGIISIAPVVLLYILLQRQFMDAFSSAVKS